MDTSNRDIYKSALGLLGEISDPTLCEDYEDRAPYLLASFCTVVLDTDKRLRSESGLDPTPKFSPVFLALDGTFPLCDQLIPSATFYLAAMLVIDENPDLSDSIYEKYCDCIAAASTPKTTPDTSGPSTAYATCESIVEKYFFD